MNTVEFAIVTVVKGDLVGLIKTRKAIETQTYKNWKHVIIYGGNDPKAIKYIQELNPQNTIYRVELDSGIYNAMNKGWKLSPENCYIYFLNARDVFAELDSLEIAASELVSSNYPLWGCTTHEEIDENGENWICKLVSPPSLSNQLHAFGYRSHQAVVMHKDLIRELKGFDESYRIASDWDLIVRVQMKYTPAIWTKPLGRFEIGGMSSIKILDAHSELMLLRKKYLNYNFLESLLDSAWSAIYLRQIGYKNSFSSVLKLLKISGLNKTGYSTHRIPLIQIYFKGRSLKGLLWTYVPLTRSIVIASRIFRINVRFLIIKYMLKKLRIAEYKT
jgi:hypothetical protein